MVNIVAPVENMILKEGDNLANNAVKAAKANAPVDSGLLRNSINTYKTGRGTWLVTTDASGPNGFAYPARIEAGERVYPTKGNAIYFHGGWHLFADASRMSHFMEKTMSMLHI